MRHADLIRALLDAEKSPIIQKMHPNYTNGVWWNVPLPSDNLAKIGYLAGMSPVTDWQVRFKPEPKPDIVRFAKASPNDTPKTSPAAARSWTWWSATRAPADNLKATWDGETGKLKSVEII